jgi:hypothetical protein
LQVLQKLLPVVTDAVLTTVNPHEDQIKALLPTLHRAVDELASFSFGSKVRLQPLSQSLQTLIVLHT